MKVKILEGNCLDSLKSLPDESIHTVVTSPPYYGLRSYETIPQVWEGDNNCKHKWSSVRTKRPNSSGGPSKKQSIKGSDNFRESTDYKDRASYSSYCSKCSAWKGELGMEPSPQEFISHLVMVFKEVGRVLRKNGSLWVNISDSYNGSGGAGGDYNIGGLKEGQPKYPGRNVQGLRPKELIGIPWKLAFALQEDGWLLRQDLIWAKGVSYCDSYSGSVMPEPISDRFVRAHEYIFLLTKGPKYFFDIETIREPNSILDSHGGRNPRSVWAIPLQPYPGSHFAVFPQALIEPCIKAGTSEKGCCAECGSPYERLIEEIGSIGNKKSNTEDEFNWELYDNEGVIDIQEETIERKTMGWRKTCKCKSNEIVPCTVLDPFGGAGTTALVAHNLDRDSISLELNPKYCNLQEKRLRDEADLFIDIERRKI